MRRALLLVIGAALALPPPAAAARFGLGVEPGHSAQRVADRVEAYTGRSVTVIGPFAVAVDAPSARGLAAIRGVSYVERLSTKQRRLSFTPNDPLLARQWYLDRVRAFDAWPRMPVFARVKVAVVDSGIDATHPDLKDAIGSGQSFVRSSWRTDTNGHGTFVAGQIAAAVNNGLGIAGLAFQAELMIAKVVRADGTISPEAEARAIRWAVDNDARVINLSFGGTRYGDSGRDAYSALEAAAVEYAVRNDVLVVAAVGNGDKAPRAPWEYANYPAALPHVLGVSAVARDGSVPDFSNRDAVFNDIAAPGEGILSTVPRDLTAGRLPCALQGYSECGPLEFRRGDGTSFAAPLVTAAASLVLGDRPFLKPNQVAWVLERSARDVTPARGCLRCWNGRDDHTGWGVLDVGASIDLSSSSVPFRPDQREPNDEAGARAQPVYGRRQEIHATLDYWNDQTDVYRIRIRRGQRLLAVLEGLPRGAETTLALWRPGTRQVDELARQRRLAVRDDVGVVKQILHRAERGGWYYLQVKLSTPLASNYTLRFVKSPVRRRAGARRPARRAASGPGSQQQRLAAPRP
jgi:Subtilase family